MTFNIKILGLAFAAVIAMSGFGAPGASAANFTASSYPASGEGGQATKHVLTIQGQKVECTEAKFTGTLAAASEQMTITPSYNGCTAFGYIGAKIDMNGCDYLFTSGTGSTGDGHISCPAGKSIVITAGGCTVHIHASFGITSRKIHFAKVPFGFWFSFTWGGVHATITSSFPCTLSAGNSTMSYSGSTEFKSTEGKSIHVG